jgi:class 3 adenylate cyclase
VCTTCSQRPAESAHVDHTAPARAARAGSSVLATVVFTDIVSSTERAAALGDREWRHLLDHHDAVPRRGLACHHGAEIARIGDGFLATFDSPARAVKCVAATMEVRASSRPPTTRRCPRRGGRAATRRHRRHRGPHRGRVCARAEPDEILVSQTVKDATTGSNLQFTDRGEHQLKGVPDRWQLCAAQA